MHGVYLVWLVQERGFSPPLVATILAAGELCIFALEVPTGWMADRLGHRLSLIAGSVFQVCGMAAFWCADTAVLLLASSLLIAIGDTFRSGADQALLYRTCVALDRESEFQRIEARTRAVSLVALVGMLLLGGALATTLGYAVAWITEIACCSVGLALASLMVEPPEAGLNTRDYDSTDDEADLKVGGYEITTIAWLIAPAALLAGIGETVAFLAQTDGSTSVAGVTWLVAAMTLAEAFGAQQGARAWRNDGRLHWVLAACGAALSAVPLFVPAGLIVAAVGLALVQGLIHPLRAAALQRVAGDGMRARIASLASACDKACTTLALLGVGTFR